MSKYAEAIMNGEKRISTGYGDKSIHGVHAMLTDGEPEEIAHALMNGKKRISTDFGDKSHEGVMDMIKKHKEEHGIEEGSIGSAIIGKSKLGSKEAGDKLDAAKAAMYKSLGVKKGSVKRTSTIVGSDGKVTKTVTHESKTLRELRSSLNEAKKFISSEGHDGTYNLIHSKSGKQMAHGDKVTDFRGEKSVLVGGTAPHKPGSTGHSYTGDKENPQRHYASVWGLEWKKTKDSMDESYKNWIPPHAIWHQTSGDHSGHISRVNDRYQYEIFDKYGKSKIKDDEEDLPSAKKAVLNHLTNIKESIDEATNPWKRYESLEDDNRHSENVIHMAKHVGSPEDVVKAKAIFARHKKEGHLTDDNGYDRKVLNDKLWPKFHKAFAPK